MDGSGSGSRAGSGYRSILLTNGSGSGSRRPKNIWIRWIRIRIRISNTGRQEPLQFALLGVGGPGNVWSLKPWIRIRIQIGIQPKMLDPDEMSADPQPCFQELEDQGILDPNQDGGGEEDQPHDEILAELERCQSELRSGRTVNQSEQPASPPAFIPTCLTLDSGSRLC
jgi:hypothetical protein